MQGAKRPRKRNETECDEMRITVSFIYLIHSYAHTVWVNTVKVLLKLRQGQPTPRITTVHFASKFSHRNYSHNDGPSVVPRR